MRIDKVMRIKGRGNKNRYYKEDPNSMVAQEQLLLNNEKEKNKEEKTFQADKCKLYYPEIPTEREYKGMYLARKKKKKSQREETGCKKKQ